MKFVVSVATAVTLVYLFKCLTRLNHILFQVVGKGIAKTRKMDVFIVDGDDVILKNIATIRRNPEVDSFEVCCLEIRPLS